MATRSAKSYQGEDMTPVQDWTDDVIWEESEFGTRAWQGEGSASTIVIRDPLGQQGSGASLPAGLTMRSLASKNLFVVQVGSDMLFRGRVGIKNYSREGQYIERYRQVECELHDTNWDLGNINVHGYSRPSETGQARVQGIIASYLSGSPRPTTNLNGSNYISSSNLITLPPTTFNRTSPLEAIRETAGSENKQFFVTGDTIGGGSLFYDGNDSTAYACTLSISDREDEVDYSSVFPPIWNVGPASTEDGAELVDEIVYFYGSEDDQFVTVHNESIHALYGHSSTTIFDDTADTAELATARANAALSFRQYEDKVYNVTLGPLSDAQVVLIKHGMTIPIKARAIPDADDAAKTMRITQCRYTTPIAGTWFAHLQLGRPWRMGQVSQGPRAETLIPDVGTFDPGCDDNGACTETFSRTDLTGWGTSEILGINWTEDGSGSLIASQGRAYLPPLSGGNNMYLDFTSLSQPVEILMALEMRAPPAGGAIFPNELDMQVDVRASLGAVGNGLWRWAIGTVDADDVGSQIGITSSVSGIGGGASDSFLIPGDFQNPARLWVVMRCEARFIKIKAWYAGGAEPVSWTAEIGPTSGDNTSPRYLVITNRATNDPEVSGQVWVNSICMRQGASCSNGMCGCGPEAGQFASMVLVGNGDGTTTDFGLPHASGYVPGSLLVTVDGIYQNATETNPAAGLFELDFAPESDEVIHASWRVL